MGTWKQPFWCVDEYYKYIRVANAAELYILFKKRRGEGRERRGVDSGKRAWPSTG